MNLETEVQKFYSKIKFPGTYTLTDFDFYDLYENRFLKPYVDACNNSYNILEIGCGTGYITNLIAYKNKHCTIDAIDFSDSIDNAKNFSKKNNIKNVNYFKTNFLDFKPVKKYDVIISNGVLHHMPEHQLAISKINELNSPMLVLGVYNTFGKMFKKFFNVKYVNELLYQDQELCPYETSFTHKAFLKLFPNYTLKNSVPNNFVNLRNLGNYKNGGLTIYTLEIG